MRRLDTDKAEPAFRKIFRVLPEGAAKGCEGFRFIFGTIYYVTISGRTGAQCFEQVLTRLSYKSVPKCLTKVSPQRCHKQHVVQERPTGEASKIVPKEYLTRPRHKNVPRGFHTRVPRRGPVGYNFIRVSRKSVIQTVTGACLAGVFQNSVWQNCPKK